MQNNKMINTREKYLQIKNGNIKILDYSLSFKKHYWVNISVKVKKKIF